MVKSVVAILLVLFLVSATAGAQEKKQDTTRHGRIIHREIILVDTGVASYYDNKFEGRRTANGELFSQQKMTAASNTLPLNSWVRVTNLRNNRSVVVKITDRMHKRNTRIIDLSLAAASKLSFVGRGLTRVKVEYLGKKKPAVKPSPARNK